MFTMESSIDFDAVERLMDRIDNKAINLFKATPRKLPLKVWRSFEKISGKEKKTVSVKCEMVSTVSQINTLQISKDASHIFLISQQRAWAALDISRELFE